MENMRTIVETSMSVVKLLGNANNLDERLKTLKRKLEQLSSRKIDVNTEVEYAELQGKRRKREIENWSINVEMIENKVQNIKQEVQKIPVFTTFMLGNQVEKLIREVVELVDQGRFPQGLTFNVMETSGHPLLTTKLVGQTFHRNLHKICESLMKVDILSIGIHGMEGVGKTALAMHVHNRLLEDFNVCWVTVSKDFRIKKLQIDISKAVNLDLSNEDDVKKRAGKLAQALRRMKLVLILDDVWEYFSLEEVGIPVDVNGCKLILTTRISNVCNMMCCQENVSVEPLNEKEAWDLFMEKFGHDIKLPLEVSDIARSITKECAGLPLRIITMAKSMRGVDIDIHAWRNALEKLKRSMEPMSNISPNGKFKRTITYWEKGELLGGGSFGSVYEGISDDGFFFAIKEVSLLDQGVQGRQSVCQLKQEIALLSQFEHENIVQYYGSYKDESKLYIFLELVAKGTLASLYRRYNLRDSQVSAYTRQILHGLNYLHVWNVIHRDIKCSNILVDANGSVKLADFGLAKATKLSRVKSCKGTAFWMAPEVVNMTNQGYGLSADIWSLGCTVLEMLTRQTPYADCEPTEALFKIGRGEPPSVPNYVSTDAWDFILQCLKVNPNDRPSAAQLLEHPFVKRPLPTINSHGPIMAPRASARTTSAAIQNGTDSAADSAVEDHGTTLVITSSSQLSSFHSLSETDYL